MKLWAISDLHIGIPKNRQALEEITARPEDWLILAGDVGEKPSHLREVFELLGQRFARLIWVPGNHELWTHPSDENQLRGEARYQYLVALCREHQVLTPEDPYPLFAGDGGEHLLVPMFLHYDYSFRPDGVPFEEAVAWAERAGTFCQDEALIQPEPYDSFADWCAARCDLTEGRLAQLPPRIPLVLINHNPLHRALCTLPRIPRFSIWSGTRRSEDWHRRFHVAVMVSGHLHVRSTRFLDGVRCEEVSFGYPSQRQARATINNYLREILPGRHVAADQRDRWYR